MPHDDLDRLELDLRAVAERLEGRRSWAALEPRARRAARRPQRALLWTAALTALCAAAGFWAPGAWLVAAGLALAVLPDRVREARSRRRELADAGAGDLFALYRAELLRRHASSFLQALVSSALALLFAAVAVLAPTPWPGLAAAALLAARACVSLAWLLPRASRELRALEGEGAEA